MTVSAILAFLIWKPPFVIRPIPPSSNPGASANAGTAVRDATGIVSFNQFTNQIDYAGVSKEMNARAIREALKGKDPATLNGKQIRFIGAFTYDPHSAGVIRITPIKLEVQS